MTKQEMIERVNELLQNVEPLKFALETSTDEEEIEVLRNEIKAQYVDALRQKEAQNRKEQMRLQKQKSESSNDKEMLNALMQMVAGQQEEISLLRQLVASSQNIESQPKGFTERDVSTAQGNRTRMSRFNKGI